MRGCSIDRIEKINVMHTVLCYCPYQVRLHHKHYHADYDRTFSNQMPDQYLVERILQHFLELRFLTCETKKSLTSSQKTIRINLKCSLVMARIAIVTLQVNNFLTLEFFREEANLENRR